MRISWWSSESLIPENLSSIQEILHFISFLFNVIQLIFGLVFKINVSMK